tara:strand:+ start:322 stop:504 length:183 start_codon:yes stop_codon:yes gene_type:complete
MKLDFRKNKGKIKLCTTDSRPSRFYYDICSDKIHNEKKAALIIFLLCHWELSIFPNPAAH